MVKETVFWWNDCNEHDHINHTRERNALDYENTRTRSFHLRKMSAVQVRRGAHETRW